MNDCSQHKKDVAGITDMKIVAEMIGDLHYETLSKLLGHLANKIEMDAWNDTKSGRANLGRALYDGAVYLKNARLFIGKAWEISKPFMGQPPTSL
jgi:hypothetical protein